MSGFWRHCPFTFLSCILVIFTVCQLYVPHVAAQARSFQQAESDEKIVFDLSDDHIAITADFDGSEILIFGAVERYAPLPFNLPLEVIITVQGPSQEIIVRKKERVGGIWINTEAAKINKAPSFYVVATTSPVAAIVSETENLRNRISIPRVIRAVGLSEQTMDAPDFVDALIDIRRSEGLFRVNEGSVLLSRQTLFNTRVSLPDNLVEGDYSVRVFLVRDGKVVDHVERTLNVRKEGLERFLFRLSRENPLIYGILALLMAVAAGWGASAAFRLIRH